MSHDLEVLRTAGIGVCSGITGDPHALITRPGILSPNAKPYLMTAELELGTVAPDAGRYILTVARRTADASTR